MRGLGPWSPPCPLAPLKPPLSTIPLYIIDAWKFSLTGAGIFVTTVVAGSIQLRCSFKLARRPFIRDLVFYISAVCWTFAVIYRKEIRTAEAVGMYSVKVLLRLCPVYRGEANGSCWIRHVPAGGHCPQMKNFPWVCPPNRTPPNCFYRQVLPPGHDLQSHACVGWVDNPVY